MERKTCDAAARAFSIKRAEDSYLGSDLSFGPFSSDSCFLAEAYPVEQPSNGYALRTINGDYIRFFGSEQSPTIAIDTPLSLTIHIETAQLFVIES